MICITNVRCFSPAFAVRLEADDDSVFAEEETEAQRDGPHYGGHHHDAGAAPELAKMWRERMTHRYVAVHAHHLCRSTSLYNWTNGKFSEWCNQMNARWQICLCLRGAQGSFLECGNIATAVNNNNNKAAPELRLLRFYDNKVRSEFDFLLSHSFTWELCMSIYDYYGRKWQGETVPFISGWNTLWNTCNSNRDCMREQWN